MVWFNLDLHIHTDIHYGDCTKPASYWASSCRALKKRRKLHAGKYCPEFEKGKEEFMQSKNTGSNAWEFFGVSETHAWQTYIKEVKISACQHPVKSIKVSWDCSFLQLPNTWPKLLQENKTAPSVRKSKTKAHILGYFTCWRHLIGILSLHGTWPPIERRFRSLLLCRSKERKFD